MKKAVCRVAAAGDEDAGAKDRGDRTGEEAVAIGILQAAPRLEAEPGDPEESAAKAESPGSRIAESTSSPMQPRGQSETRFSVQSRCVGTPGGMMVALRHMDFGRRCRRDDERTALASCRLMAACSARASFVRPTVPSLAPAAFDAVFVTWLLNRVVGSAAGPGRLHLTALPTSFGGSL